VIDEGEYMISLKTVDELDISLIVDVLNIDSAVYPVHLRGTFDELYGRFTANRDTYVLLYDNNDLIGYLCLLPVKDELYEKISNDDRLYDSDIPYEQIEQYQPHNTYKLYAISTAIRPDYQGKGLSGLLIRGFYKYLLEKRKSNIRISSVLSSAVTSGGDLLLKKMGFTRIKELSGGYMLYELQVDDAYYALIEERLDSGHTSNFQ